MISGMNGLKKTIKAQIKDEKIQLTLTNDQATIKTRSGIARIIIKIKKELLFQKESHGN